MNKMELASEVAKRTKLSRAKALEAVNSAIEAIRNSLRKGQRVQLVGFGSFLVKQRKARTGRNPRTGETIQIKARKVPAFSAGAELRAALR
jgi:nucleoid DNA-binding protein